MPSSPDNSRIQSAISPPKSPRPQVQRSVTSPLPGPFSPSAVNIDSVVPPIQRPGSSDSARTRSRSRTLVKGGRVQSPLSAKTETSTDLDSQLDQPPSLPQKDKQDEEEQERRRRSRANRHKREFSIDSKSMYRISVASSRYGDPISRTTTPGFPNTGNSRYRNYLDEVPPLPTGPLRSYTPSPFTAAPEPYQFQSQAAFENDRLPDSVDPPRTSGFRVSPGRPGFELGFDFDATIVKPQDNPPQTARLSNMSNDLEKSKNVDADSQKKPDQTLGLPKYSLDQDFSVSNFARGLGLGDPYHSTTNSTSSSESSPSDAPTRSSYSTQPSEPPSADIKPPPSPYKYELDSPTDPLFQQGRFKQPQKYNRFAEPETAQEPQEAPRPPSSRGENPPIKVESPPPTPAAPKSPAQTRRTRCRGCGEVIIGKSVSSADGRLTGRWHKACFVCFTCQSPFTTADFYVLNNNPYCQRHYHELNGSLCSFCNLGIEGPCLQTEQTIWDPKIGRERKELFHPDCFRCKTCRIVLRGDYLEWNGDVYCDRDGRRAAALAYQPSSPGLAPAGYSNGNGPPPGYARRPSNSSRRGGPPPPRGAPAPGGPNGYRPSQGSLRGRGRGGPRPSNSGGNRGRPGGPPQGPPNGQYPPNKNGGYGGLKPPSIPSDRSQGGNLGVRRFPERRTTKFMML